MIYLSVIISYPSTQFEKLYGPFVNLGTHLPPKDNSPFIKFLIFEKLKFSSIINVINTF